MTLREKIEVMEAFERGEEIEHSYICSTRGWDYVNDPSWSFKDYDYRVKPKPKKIVTIEKWLCSITKDSYYVIEGTKEFISGRSEKVKLLDTYEVEI